MQQQEIYLAGSNYARETNEYDGNNYKEITACRAVFTAG